MYGEFLQLNTVILGVSPDKAAAHRKFTDELKLPFPLLCDPEKQVMKLYGALGEKMMYGKVTMGVIRSTVLINPDGKVIRHWQQVEEAADHPRHVLETLRKVRQSAS